MSRIIPKVQLFLDKANRGEAEMPEHLVEEFGELAKEMLRKQFNQPRREFAIRMSSIGRPLCQQQMEKAGAEAEPEDYSFRMKMLIGDAIEALAVVIMKAAGIEMEMLQEKVTLDGINGSLDMVIDDQVYDVKSASPYAFDNKFVDFDKVLADDNFGYIVQGFAYAAAVDKPFGGWIVVNKSTGEWRECAAPKLQQQYSRDALTKIKHNVDKLVSGAEFERCFEPVEETYYRKPTGNYVLPMACEYCKFKKPCWGDSIEQRQSGKNETGKFKWYYVGDKDG